MSVVIREIQPQDNGAIAAIIRQVLTEFGANRPGFAWADPELDALYETYQPDGSGYWVVVDQDIVVGGGGIAPFPCEYPALCELQKMYLLPDYRGRGLGQTLMQQLLDAAHHWQYQGCYLETFTTMTGAMRLYERCGFQRLAQPLGNSGHNSCDRFYCRWFTPNASTQSAG